MARINLLPWREEARRERTRRFFSYSIGVWILAVLGTFLAYTVVLGMVSHQENRNKFLQTEIAKVDDEIKEIENIRLRKQELIDRMDVIQGLQSDRTQIVHVFDDLVRKMPKGMYLTTLNKKNKQMTLTGIAQSNARVSSLMKNLDDSDWFANPDLEVINVTPDEGTRISQFTLKVSEQAIGARRNTQPVPEQSNQDG